MKMIKRVSVALFPTYNLRKRNRKQEKTAANLTPFLNILQRPNALIARPLLRYTLKIILGDLSVCLCERASERVCFCVKSA